MFGIKHKKAKYVKCPYCGANPIISEGPSLDDENKIVMHYQCPKNHLTTGDTEYPSRALEIWLLTVSKVLNVDDVVCDYFKEQKRKGKTNDKA